MSELDLEERVRRVERQNRLLRWALLALALMLIVNTLAGSLFRRPAWKVGMLSAQQVQLHDDQGNLVGLFHTVGPRINLFDNKGIDRVRLSILNGVPEMTLFDEHERERVFLRIHDGEPLLTLRDEAGVDRVGMSTSYDTPSVHFWDAKGRAGAMLNLSEHADPYIRVLTQVVATPRIG